MIVVLQEEIVTNFLEGEIKGGVTSWQTLSNPVAIYSLVGFAFPML